MRILVTILAAGSLAFLASAQGSDVYVSLQGDDAIGDGSPGYPFLTIEKGIEAADPRSAGGLSTTIHIGAGEFKPASTLYVPGLTSLRGSGMGATTIRVQGVNINGDYIGVDFGLTSSLAELTVALPSSLSLAADAVATLISMWGDPLVGPSPDGGTASLRFCEANGAANTAINSVGVAVMGGNASTALVADCRMVGLAIGLAAMDSAANITRCRFEDIRGDAVFGRLGIKNLLPIDKGLRAERAPRLGVAGDIQNTGLNQFRNVAGLCLDNQTPSAAVAEINDWGAYTQEEISGKVSGLIDTTGTKAAGPATFLGKGIGPGSVVVRVTDQSNAPIASSANPACSIQALGVSGQYDAPSQTFIFNAITEGQWSVSASANGFSQASSTASVRASTVTPITIVLAPGSGNPPGSDPGTGGGTSPGDGDAGTTPDGNNSDGTNPPSDTTDGTSALPSCGAKDTGWAYACAAFLIWRIGAGRRSRRSRNHADR